MAPRTNGASDAALRVFVQSSLLAVTNFSLAIASRAGTTAYVLNKMLSSFVDLVRLGEPYDVEYDDDPFLVSTDGAGSHSCNWNGCPVRA